MSRKLKKNHVIRLRIANRRIEEPTQIANHLAKHFAEVSSTKRYTSDFQRRKIQEDTTAVYVNMFDTSTYNCPFSMKNWLSLYRPAMENHQDLTTSPTKC
jgi:hypothetical protein